MNVAIVTGAGGLVGSEASEYLIRKKFHVIGIDNDMRKDFFGEEASTVWNTRRLSERYLDFHHCNIDIRDSKKIFRTFEEYGTAIQLVIHAAAQPSHDWAARDPFKDFTINANGTLILLEATRRFSPEAVFIFLSTNKVYGDRPNQLPLIEQEKRWEIEKGHPYYEGIDETMSIDQCTHSLFGASKSGADVLVQEYGRYFGIKTGCFRGGCLTGSGQSAAELHGFLSYLMKCTVTGECYTIYGYKGKQVRDNIHSTDLVEALFEFYKKPRIGEVYNMGGGRFSNCSIWEAIRLCEEIAGKKVNWQYSEKNRMGDHIWYISSLKKFKSHYPAWKQKFDLKKTLLEIYENGAPRWKKDGRLSGQKGKRVKLST